MQKKSLEEILYSTAGVAMMLGIFVAANAIIASIPARMDMTQEKAYTISAGTKAVLKKLDTPITIRFYCTQSQTATPESVYLKQYAGKVENLLHEYKQVAGRNLVIKKFDPQPDTDAEDSARLDGLEARPLPGNDRFYLGLAVTLADERVTIPFLAPDREKLLEYDITRALTRVLSPTKATVGVMSPLPLFGGSANPMMMQAGRQPEPAWTIIQQLKQDFNVVRVETNADKIADDVKVLLVVHPTQISDQAQYAIDQFVLRGGKLIAFLDPVSAFIARQQSPMMGGSASSSSLDKLLKAWGVEFDSRKVVADMDFKMQLRDQNNQLVEAPAWLALTGDALNQSDIITSQIGSLWLPMCGAFTGTPASGLKETGLLHSSKDAELTDSFLAQMGGENIMNSFKASGVLYNLAIRLTGRFKTAYPDGAPTSDSNSTNATARQPDNSLKESQVDTSVVLVGDSDMLADEFSLRKVQSFFGTLVSPMNANLDFAQNLVEQMAGDSNLIGVRSRASLSRPFTLVKKIEAEAQARGQAKIQELQRSLNETQQRLSQLQQQKTDKDQRLILSPEQQAEIASFRQKQAEVGRDLRQAQKDLRKEVVSLQTRYTWLNILAMPLAVTATGISIAVFKRRKTSAK